MPQMAPYNWIMLFFMFNMIIMMIFTHNHFFFYNINNKTNTLIKNNFKLTW